jgi:hypothetical protein
MIGFHGHGIHGTHGKTINQVKELHGRNYPRLPTPGAWSNAVLHRFDKKILSVGSVDSVAIEMEHQRTR